MKQPSNETAVFFATTVIKSWLANYTDSLARNWCTNGVRTSFNCLFRVVFLVFVRTEDLAVASNASIPCLACLIVSILANTSLQSIATRGCLLATSSSSCTRWLVSSCDFIVISHCSWSNTLPVFLSSKRTERERVSCREINSVSCRIWRWLNGVRISIDRYWFCLRDGGVVGRIRSFWLLWRTWWDRITLWGS